MERALDLSVARIGAVEAPIAELWDPETVPLDILPWLAWGFSVDAWDADWSEADKRAAVAGSIALHRKKGTRESVEIVLARFDQLARLIEWFEATPRATPHTFEVIVPMVLPDGTAPGGRRSTAEFVEAIIREISRVKPLREHMTVIQSLAAGGSASIAAAARAFVEARQDMALTPDTDPIWPALLQTEDGEPLQSDDGSFLDSTP